MTDPTDEAQIDRVRNGDRAAFAGLVDRYWDRICGWIFRLGGSRHVAEDVTQEAFLKAWVALPQYEPGSGFRAWLFRIARNTYLDHCRRREEAPGGTTFDLALGREPEPIEVAQERELVDAIEQGVHELADEFRTPFLLRTVESMAYSEIAEILTLNEDTVRWRIFKARQLLLKQLDSHVAPKESTS